MKCIPVNRLITTSAGRGMRLQVAFVNASGMWFAPWQSMKELLTGILFTMGHTRSWVIHHERGFNTQTVHQYSEFRRTYRLKQYGHGQGLYTPNAMWQGEKLIQKFPHTKYAHQIQCEFFYINILCLILFSFHDSTVGHVLIEWWSRLVAKKT